ncbi:CidA/LrgA family protein [Kordiimonas sp.]|uniref:CidA/LrgA family protein n=1 Tax=Kordiimonas sp. TaxID=1970157 RepID=UPI003A8DB3EC
MVKVAGGFVFFALLVLGLDGLCQALGLAIPTPIVAMGVLAIFFVSHGKVPEFIDDTANALFRIFPLLFIPALVSIITLTDLIESHWLVLLLVVTVSSFLGLAAAALAFKAMRHDR